MWSVVRQMELLQFEILYLALEVNGKRSFEEVLLMIEESCEVANKGNLLVEGKAN